MFGIKGYLKDYGDGPLKIIREGRSNLITGFIGLILLLAMGILLCILCREPGGLYFVSPFCLISILIIWNNIKKIKKGKSKRLDKDSIDKAEVFIQDFLSNNIDVKVLLDYLDAALIEYFTIKPIVVESRVLEQKIRQAINNNINIAVFHEWIDTVWFLDIFELKNDTYYKFEVIENYKLEGKIIPIRELKGMI
ncbi:MAG: hypothetical protein N4A50_04790 [Vallitalea sp.]|jgi:hypothetical protein|nr:hypothetical protein [Vallitalea sp.]